jgi:hypothetical protein
VRYLFGTFGLLMVLGGFALQHMFAEGLTVVGAVVFIVSVMHKKI